LNQNSVSVKSSHAGMDKSCPGQKQNSTKEIRGGGSEERRNLENKKRLSSESRYVCWQEKLRQNDLVAFF
jgi:hypothetical protein